MAGKPREDRSAVASIYVGVRLTPADHANLRQVMAHEKLKTVSSVFRRWLLLQTRRYISEHPRAVAKVCPLCRKPK